MTEKTYAVVTGGGTSGHVVPAMAIVEGLEDLGIDARYLAYVGAMRGVETSLVPQLGIRAAYLPIAGLQRSISPRDIWRNLVLPFRLLRCSIAAHKLMSQWQPQVVVSVGGYASEPMSRAALKAGIPLVCVSYDRTPGLATRRQAQKSTANLVAFGDSPLPHPIFTGAPVRRSILAIDRSVQRDSARAELGIPSGSLLLVIVGGSLGSAVLNSLANRIVGDADAHNIAVIHVCGERYTTEPMPTVSDGVWYERVGYTDKMNLMLAAADLVVCRAGASTVNEIACVGVPSVVVPWSGSAGGHQVLNAEWLSAADAAVVMTEDEVAHRDATATVVNLIRDSHRLAEISSNARKLGESMRERTLPAAIVSVVNGGDMEQWSVHA